METNYYQIKCKQTKTHWFPHFLSCFLCWHSTACSAVLVSILMFTYKVNTEEEKMRKTDGGEENWMSGKVLALKVKDGGDGKRINIWGNVRKTPEGIFFSGRKKKKSKIVGPQTWSQSYDSFMLDHQFLVLVFIIHTVQLYHTVVQYISRVSFCPHS